MVYKDMYFLRLFGEAHDLRFNSELANNSILDNLIVDVGGYRYFIGELANRQSEFLLSTQSEKRTGSAESDILFKTAFVLLDGVSSQEVEFNLVTGLPVDEYKQFKEVLREQLLKNHYIKVIDGDSSIEKNIIIKKCKVVPQPFGTIFNEMLTDDGGIKTESYVDSILGVVDIGFRTTDFVVTNKLEFIDKLSFTSSVALNTAYKLISRELKEQLNINKSIYQLDDIVQAGKIVVKGKQYDILELKDKAFNLAAQQIISEINSFWPQLWEFSKVLITGGGGIALFNYLKDYIDNCYLVHDGQFSNVNGYLKIANRFFKE